MSNVNSIFEELAAESGKNAKLDILRKHKANEQLKRACFLALDPFTQFFIRKIPKYKYGSAPRLTLDKALDALSDLSSRKVTGNAAIKHLTDVLSGCSADDARVITRVIEKDLRCGVDTAVNKIWPGLIHEYPCMLASAYDQKLVDKLDFPAYVQCKLDGMRFNAIVNNGNVEFRSRNGKEIHIADPMFGLYFIEMAQGENVVFDGELICRDKKNKVLDRKTGNGILNKAVKGTQSMEEGQSVCAVLWDLIPYDDFQKGVCNLAYEIRLKALLYRTDPNRLTDLRVIVVETFTVENIDEARGHFERYLNNGQEGIILKSKKMFWEDKRSRQQIKFKGELECDLKVVEWQEGTGKNVGRLGALICESADGLIRVGVGTGFTDEERTLLTESASLLKIVTVKYNARIKDKRSDVDSLFLPVFVEIREDKTVADHSRVIK